MKKSQNGFQIFIFIVFQRMDPHYYFKFPVTSFENALFNKGLFNQNLLSVALFKSLG